MSGYIGTQPVPQATQTRDTFTATSGQTSFATSGYTPGFLDVFLNGVHLVNGTDYTASNGSDVVLTSGAASGDNLEVVAYTTFQTGDFVPTSGGTFSGNVAITGDLTIADKIVHSGDTDTTIRFPAADTVTVETAGSERMQIDSSGNLLVGTTNLSVAASSTESGMAFDENPGFLQLSASSFPSLILNRFGSDGDISLFRKDGTTVGSIGVGGSDIYHGSGDTGLKYYAQGDAIHPYNPSTLSNRDNAVDLGMSSIRFDDIYATNGTIQTSDRNEKQDIEALSDAERRVAVACKGLLRKFRWKSAVEEKGDDARIHFGIIAQDLQAAFEAEGLDAGRYAMFIHSTWTDEETGEEKSRMGVRYSELLAFIIAAL